jgi:hypothetical protein
MVPVYFSCGSLRTTLSRTINLLPRNVSHGQCVISLEGFVPVLTPCDYCTCSRRFTAQACLLVAAPSMDQLRIQARLLQHQLASLREAGTFAGQVCLPSSFAMLVWCCASCGSCSNELLHEFQRLTALRLSPVGVFTVQHSIRESRPSLGCVDFASLNSHRRSKTPSPAGQSASRQCDQSQTAICLGPCSTADALERSVAAG